MTVIFQLKLAGFFLILLALLHAAFPRRFKWKDECSRLSLLNRQLMYIHTLFLAIVLLLMGLLCLSEAADLYNTRLGTIVCRGLMAFWLMRLLAQFFGYSPKLWRGRRFETAVHVLFICLWTYFSIIFGMAGWRTIS